MSITGWSPLRELETLRERLDRLVSELTGREGGMLAVPLDVQETADSIIVRASMPGFKPEDIAVEISRGVLTIRGESREEREEASGTWHLKERRVGTIYRAVTLPAPVKEDQAQASLEHGVLEIRLPKAEPAPQRRIPIQVRS